MDRFTDRAFVLGALDYGDADRVVTLFTLGRGKMTAFAAGARKSKRRFAGALEPCTLIKAQLVSRRGTTFRLDSVDIERTHHALRGDLALISRALYCAELCRELLREEEAQPELFSLLEDYLAALEARAAGPTSLLAFELRALAIAGLMPRLDSCAICGQGLDAEPRFDPAQGGAVCSRCAMRERIYPPRAPAAVLEALAAIQQGGRIPMPADQRRLARELLNNFISHQLGRRLKAVDFMTQVGTD
ncbi:MAG: DNA repair protein RecO [Myxococcota bacterium]|nr:DNA repair protein RecO [Myxococcota bacterium]